MSEVPPSGRCENNDCCVHRRLLNIRLCKFLPNVSVSQSSAKENGCLGVRLTYIYSHDEYPFGLVQAALQHDDQVSYLQHDNGL